MLAKKSTKIWLGALATALLLAPFIVSVLSETFKTLVLQDFLNDLKPLVTSWANTEVRLGFVILAASLIVVGIGAPLIVFARHYDGNLKARHEKVLETSRSEYEERLTTDKIEFDQLRRWSKALEKQLLDAHLELDIDYNTGVPNEKKMRKDLADALWDMKEGSRKLTLIYIDLIKFRNLNVQFQRKGATKIIHDFAQQVYAAMRRDEVLYKRAENDLYRRYTGGDEFLFILNDTEEGALKYVQYRLRPQARTVSKRLTAELGEAVELDFHAAVFQVLPHDVSKITVEHGDNREQSLEKFSGKCEDIISRLEEILSDAQLSDQHVLWRSLSTSDKRVKSLGTEAVESFKREFAKVSLPV